MKVHKFYEFLFEGNTPEDFIHDVLDNIQKRLLTIFDEEEVKKFPEFKNYNIRLAKSYISMDSAVEKSYKLKFTDDSNILYILTATINLKDAIPTSEADFKLTDIKKCSVSFDKYEEVEGVLKLIDRLLSRTIDPIDIVPEYLIKLKVELDKGITSDEEVEEFKIEVEEENPKAQNTQEENN